MGTEVTNCGQYINCKRSLSLLLVDGWMDGCATRVHGHQVRPLQSSGWLGNGCCGRKQCAVHISVVDVPSLQNTKVMGPKLAKLPLLLLVNICA